MMKRNLLLLLGAIALMTVPLLIHASKETQQLFTGTDDQAEKLVAESGYEPGSAAFWEPPSAEIECMLFSLQAAIGSGLVFYCIGYYRGRHVALSNGSGQQQREDSKDAPG